MDKDSAKQKIQELVEKYEQVLESGKLKGYTEQETKNGFIEPLFNILGWDTTNKNEVSLEEQISGDRADYGFYLNGRPKFYVEAKAFKADLHNPIFAEQAIRYSWNKGVSWAVLTDFENIKVFNSEVISESLSNKLLFDIPYSEFLERFDEQLWLLSKESFKQNLIEKYATKFGKMKQRVPVGEKLYKDLSECREILTKKLSASNSGIKDDLLDEGIQKLLDRLIFIKVAEDRGIEDKTLIPLLRQQKGKETLYESMIEKFRELDEIYNSNLFTPHNFEKWSDDFGATKEVINKLQGVAGYYEYDFKAMPADILGAVYENYLGHRLSKSKKGLTIDKDAKKRKEQGIYYTPSFIVDYIVKNALKPVLDKCQSINDLKKIKVLDPACGSGSFLIKALEVINDKYKEFGNKGGEFTKQTILTENLYGVDLDEQAVEITRLNLTLSALETRMKIPLLKNIKNGNSLISGTDEELQKYFGKNFRDKNPFNWEEQFPEVFAQGGFDVIIGNPPYVVLDSNDEFLEFFKHNFESSKGGKVNLYKLFIEKSILILKNDGHLGFICPSNYMSSKDSIELRRILLNETNMIEIIEYTEKDKVFSNVTQALTTLVLKKSRNKNNSTHLVTSKHGDNNVIQEEFSKNEELEFVFENKIILAIQKNKDKISDIAECYQGEINVSTKKNLFVSFDDKLNLPLMRGNLIKNYDLIKNPNEYCPVSADKRGHFVKERVVFQEVSNQSQKRRIKATAVKNMLCGHTTNYCFPKVQDINNRLILALLNSSLLNYYFSYFNKTNHVPVGEIKEIPIPKIDKEKQKILSELADKMLDLNKELKKEEENSNKWESIKSEIEKTDKKIDEEVYKLYGLTEEEIKIIEAR